MREISFSRYEKLRRKGVSAEDAYTQAKHDGLDHAVRLTMLSSVFLTSYEESVRISRKAGDSPPSILDDPTLTPPLLRAAVQRLRKKKNA